MLIEPETNTALDALDQGVAEAVAARLKGGGRGSADADAIAERALLAGLAGAERAAARAVLGRIDAALGAPLAACGGLSQALAADRFGLGFQSLPTPADGLKFVREGGRALIDLAGPEAWWGRLLAEPELSIVAALPDGRDSLPRALMVASGQAGPTGADRTFWITDSAASDARLTAALGSAGLAATRLTSGGGLKLFVLAGYVQAEDPRLALSGFGRLTGVIGAAPTF